MLDASNTHHDLPGESRKPTVPCNWQTNRLATWSNRKHPKFEYDGALIDPLMIMAAIKICSGQNRGNSISTRATTHPAINAIC